MPLNDLERRNSPYFAFFFTEFGSFTADYINITVVEDRPIMSVKYCLPSLLLLAETYPLCSAVSLR